MMELYRKTVWERKQEQIWIPTRSKHRKTISWLYFVGGALAGLVIALLLVKRIYCLNAYQPGITAIFPGLAAVGAGFGVLSGLKINGAAFFTRYKLFFLSFSGLLIVGAVAGWLSPLFYQYNKNYCVNNFDQLAALTNQEGSAVINKDMVVIRNIYAPDAVVTQVNTGESWAAYAYYSIKFVQEIHCTNRHGDYDVIKFNADEVVMTTSSQGTWGPVGQGCTQAYSDPAGSDRWTFQRINGEWKIENFEFNIPVKTP